MPIAMAKKYYAMLNWRPNLIGQFVISMLLSLLPLSLVVIVFLNALNKQLAVTQLIVSNNYQVTKSFNFLKQELNSLERATRQNWVLKSESLDTLINEKWQSSLNSIDELSQVSATPQYTTQWRRLANTLSTTHTALIKNNQQDAALFVPISDLMAELTVWLRDTNAAQIQNNQSELSALQSSFINWLVALIPLTLLVGGGFLWRISKRLKGLTSVIDKLGQGHWQQKISVQGSTELVELGEKLRWVQEQLHMLEQQKDTFLRHVTHELKTPLASMVEGTDLLSDEIVGPITKEQQAVLELISESMVRLRTMIDSLLSYNAIRTSKDSVSEVEFSYLINKINSHFEHRLTAKQQALNWQNSIPNKPLALPRELIEMILIQLISNALKFSANEQSINIALALENKLLIMQVSDNGCGIKEQEKSQIFSAFYQGKHSKDVTLQGSGLGLTIVKESVEQLRGQLNVEHNQPQGCLFTIKIPLNNQGV
ncbi:two-component system, NtrC family, sensor histidine kinase GlrK [Pseudoalteromonas espejiana DSM 9414]|uniref:Signal transduction histidine-protein kinase/phosphatase MprB n=1 Tax=Pseudoalteromonas espejiana TaxID=28107 RepID=A0A510XST9_9GAMM|nr:HAMP domain-containing sensor histidine kinase [Pseudoalteromonas espejiana]ASM50959.1 two-component system, NtrC family, sensor histidine kinase GlrK [Pseudoalteromonas espejiana DSM 9414]GEK54092.1 two-component sensor histidine kinase [Pseudoalteromonas espejiana]